MPTIDPILRLAVSMQHNKGAYALLLGSGVSSSAGIPTGWGLVTDLVLQIAAAQGTAIKPDDAEGWFHDTFGEPMTYDSVMDMITGFKVERAELLADYIEPATGQQDEGVRTPQRAHRAIARLARAGYIRVIVTTNFDKLLEMGLEEVGITPRVISTADDVEQALPLVHQDCTIIKVHGDYASGDLKNTAEELATYDPRLNTLLSRIFSDFGIVICGWSAQWDSALRIVVDSNASRAYSTFWAVKGQLSSEGAAILEERPGKGVIHIEDADTFFSLLEEKVEAIREVVESSTLTGDVAAATMRRYLEDPVRNRIRIRQMVAQEVERVVAWLTSHVYLPATPPPPGRMEAEVADLLDIAQPLLAMFVVGCRWGTDEQFNVWVEALERILHSSRDRIWELRWQGYWALTGFLLYYAGGIAALSGGRYDTIRSLMLQPQIVFNDTAPRMPLVWVIGKVTGLLADELRRLPRHTAASHPLSDEVHDALRPFLVDLIPDERRYDELFDWFSYFAALVYVDVHHELWNSSEHWGPRGRFTFFWRGEDTAMAAIEREATRAMGEWPPLLAGFFQSDYERFDQVRRQYNLGTFEHESFLG